MKIETITVKEAMAELKVIKDLRTMKKWCRENKVEIFSDNTGRRYLYRLQFEYALERPLVRYLKKEYGKEWYKAYLSYKQHDIRMLVELEEGNKNPTLYPNDYKPKGIHEKKFLQSLEEV